MKNLVGINSYDEFFKNAVTELCQNKKHDIIIR